MLWIYRCLLVTGGIFIAIYAFARVGGWVLSRAELQKFDQLRSKTGLKDPANLAGQDDIDFSLWSDQRIRTFKKSLNVEPGPTLAVLEVDRLRIRVPVFEGTDDLALNLGAGWVKGTAKPGILGNTAIAAHRDGFFRVLKDIQSGDLVELHMQDKTMVYRVNSMEIINPDEIRVLMPSGEPILTLVTCYPFYYAGSAPQRFIVHAALQETKPAEALTTVPAASGVKTDKN